MRQKIRHMPFELREPLFEDLMHLRKDALIFPVEHIEWCSPVVIREKKNNQICLCVDFKELNKQIVKDYYPLPFIDQILDQLVGREMYSFMDFFAGYNQMALVKEDKLKTTFIIVFGTFSYHVMGFGLCNALGFWQRKADKMFADISPEELKVFINDLGVATMTCQRQLIVLHACFEQCHEYYIALNPRKYVFEVSYGSLSRHVVSAASIAIDPEKCSYYCGPEPAHFP